MTLGTRFLLFTACLLSAMLLVAWWGMARLTDSLEEELDKVAVRIGESVSEVLTQVRPGVDRSGSDQRRVQVEHRLLTDTGELIANYELQGGLIRSIRLARSDAATEEVLLDQSELMAGVASGEVLQDLAIAAIRSAQRSQLVLLGNEARHAITIPDQGVREIVDRFNQRMMIGLAMLFASGVLLSGLMAYRITRPLSALTRAAARLGTGERGVRLDDEGVVEVRTTIQAFNRMSAQLETFEAALLQARERQHMQDVSDIGQGLAHSLRNPLNAINLSIDRLNEYAQSESHGGSSVNDADQTPAQIAQQAKAQIQQINRSIQSFLSLATQGELSSEPVDLVTVIEDISLEILQRQSQTEMRSADSTAIRIGPELPDKPIIMGVQAELRAVLHALIINAVEASEELPAPTTVDIILKRDGDQLEMEIRDQGQGFPESVLKRLFEPHVTSKPDGIGMGLYLSRRIVQSRYQGQLSVEPASTGPGTTVRLTLRDRVQLQSKDPA